MFLVLLGLVSLGVGTVMLVGTSNIPIAAAQGSPDAGSTPAGEQPPAEGVTERGVGDPPDNRPSRGAAPEFQAQDLDADTRMPMNMAEKPQKLVEPQPDQTPKGNLKAHPRDAGPPDKAPKQAENRPGGGPNSIPNEIIVTFKSKAAFQGDQEHRKAGQIMHESDGTRSKLMKVPNVEAAINALKKNKDIQSVEPNFVAEASFVPNDPYYVPYQWHLKPFGVSRGSNLQGAWDRIRGSNFRIVVMDTGIDWGHPDLVGKNPLGWNFAENNGNWYDCNNHGTMVSGMAAGVSNNSLMGAAPDMGAQLYAAKIVVGCSGSSSYYTMGQALINSTHWAGTAVINISFGGGSYSQYLCDAVNYARAYNKVVVASAGNHGTQAASYPAACPGVLGVGATTQSGTRASFSSYGQPNVDVSAPGASVLAPRSGYNGGGYVFVNGTSFSSPLVAGITLLTRAKYPTWTEGTVRSRIHWAGWNPECGWACYTNNFGYGVVDAYWAVY